MGGGKRASGPVKSSKAASQAKAEPVAGKKKPPKKPASRLSRDI